KCGRNEIQPNDVNFASLNLYKTKDFKREIQVQKSLNAQPLPAISNTAMHFGPVQKILIAPTLIDREMRPRSITPIEFSQCLNNSQ
uniref:Uncharacterized protein n=1 Tax=Panagrolaimus sp. ES5 TaxID=591445 RepID=A0AC34GM68_9BILA